MLSNIALFAGFNNDEIYDLWETNGTVIGTFELTAVAGESTTTGLNPTDLTLLNGQVLFSGRNALGIEGLWTTDGTAEGTQELGSIAAANTKFGLDPVNMTVYNHTVLFDGFDAFDQNQLWVTDGTAAGTHELTGVAGADTENGLNPYDITVYDGEALFEGADAGGHEGLWVTDGTAAGTDELTGIAGMNANAGLRPVDLTDFNGEVLFNGFDSTGRGFSGLWVTNGSAAGTHELTGIVGTSTTVNTEEELDSGLNPQSLTVLGDEVLFAGNDASDDVGLWVTDGTAAGTHELTGIADADASGIDPTNLTVFNGKILFSGLDENGFRELWETDGTIAGTVELTGADTSEFQGLNPSGLVVYDDQVLFEGADANNLFELWTTDGTTVGTKELTPTVSADASGFGLSPSAILSLISMSPTISGTHVTTTTADQSINPFTVVTIVDPNTGATDTLTITLAGAGGTLADGTSFSGLAVIGGGIYRLAGTSSVVTAELNAITFTPTTGAPNTNSTTTFALSDLSSANGSLAGDSATSVVNSDPAAAPTITGTVSGQTTTSEAPVPLFAHVTIGDTNVGAIDTLLITLDGVGGTLSDGAGFSSLTTVSPGVYQLSGIAVAITSELDALVFKPTAGAAGTTSTTEFTLTDLSSVNGTPVVASTTTVVDSGITADLFWQNTSTGQASIWEMDGDVQVGGGGVANSPAPSWTQIGPGDFFHNGDGDILWQNASTGQASIWEMNGNTRIGGGAVANSPSSAWRAVGTGDFTNDGSSDGILWQNTATGQASIWNMQGNTPAAGGGAVANSPGPTWKAIGTGDFNHDGFSDILWQNSATGQLSIWDMQGNTRVSGGGAVATVPGTAWQAIGTGDFDGSGFADDIVFQNKTTGQVSIWDMHDNTRVGGGALNDNLGTSWHAVGTNGGSDILLQSTSGQATIWEVSGTTIEAGGAVSINPNPGTGWRAVGLT